MSNGPDSLREARPAVAPPSEAARRAAFERLLVAIEDEPPGLHARRVSRDSVARSTAQSLRRGAHPRTGHATSGDGRRRRVAGVGRTVVPALVMAVAAVVAVLALVLPGHRRATAPGDRTGARGGIVASGGQLLTGGHAALPTVVTDGLRRQYADELTAGRTLRTTIAVGLQRAGMRSLRRSIGISHAAGGAFVALDPRTGAIEAIGTAGRGGRRARVDTAIAAAASPAGAFTPITALAALRANEWTPGQTYDDTGQFCVAAVAKCLHNSGKAAYGPITLARSLAVDDHVFMDQLATKLNSTAPRGGPLQRTARQMGLGIATGIDLPGENAGRVPAPGMRPVGRWTASDTINLATGVGDLEVTPVQLAIAYAAIANGGTIVTPHLSGGAGDGGSTGAPHGWPTHRVALPPAALAAVRQGMKGNSSQVGGVSDDVFGSLHASVAGAVGSARYVARGREAVDGWYAGYVEDAGRPLVVVVRIQGGGFGDVVAAPVARQLFSQWLTGRPGRWKPGLSIAQ